MMRLAPMRSVSARIASTLPAAAAPRFSTGDNTAHVSSVADNESATNKDEYMQNVKREMQEWGDKIDHAGSHVERDVGRVWTKTKDAAHRLQVASADHCDRAGQGFEDAMRDLRARWRKFHPENE
jgi:hypothetical protein